MQPQAANSIEFRLPFYYRHFVDEETKNTTFER